MEDKTIEIVYKLLSIHLQCVLIFLFLTFVVHASEINTLSPIQSITHLNLHSSLTTLSTIHFQVVSFTVNWSCLFVDQDFLLQYKDLDSSAELHIKQDCGNHSRPPDSNYQTTTKFIFNKGIGCSSWDSHALELVERTSTTPKIFWKQFVGTCTRPTICSQYVVPITILQASQWPVKAGQWSSKLCS